MAVLTEIKNAISILGDAEFQEFCDIILKKSGYGVIHGLGMKAGTKKTTKGNPDTYFRKDNGKYVLVVYTTVGKNIYTKLNKDILKCFDSTLTGLEIDVVDEIVACHTSSNLNAGKDKSLHDMCEEKGIKLTIWGIDELGQLVHNKYPSLAKKYLNLNIDTYQISSIEDFVSRYDQNRMIAPLKTVFQYRDKEKNAIEKGLDENDIVIVTGKAGVGKTRLVLESIKNFCGDEDYKVLCIKSNGLNLYDDLVSYTEKPGGYLFFIDDANELKELQSVFEYIIKKYLGYMVKVVLTVRDYAKECVISEAKKYSVPKIIEIKPFTDEEIKGFLSTNMNINNEIYTDQIIRICEGNPRIAYMAGRLLNEKQSLSSITNAIELYSFYYKQYVDVSLGKDKDLCFTAGILSIVKAMEFENMTCLQTILDLYGMTLGKFKEDTLKLFQMEFVEIQLEKVAEFSDQCLANYMLYYVFVEKKMIPFSSIIQVGFTKFHDRLMQTINTLLNIFNSKETNEYLQQQIRIVWKYFKNSNSYEFDQFSKDFHLFNIEESLLLARNKINEMNKEDFDVFDIDFNKNSFLNDDTVLPYLTGYQYVDELECVLELFVGFCSKNEKNLIYGYRWLENNYCIDISSSQTRFDCQKNISKFIYNLMLEKNDIVSMIGYEWAKYSLEFNFKPMVIARKYQLRIYDYKLSYSDALVEYRKICWKILLKLAEYSEYADKLLIFMVNYARHINLDVDLEIATRDVEYVEVLLSKLKSKKISFLKALHVLLVYAKKNGIEYNKKWESVLNVEIWDLYNLLNDDFTVTELDYMEFQSDRKNRLEGYGKSVLPSDIPNLIDNINNIYRDIFDEHDKWCVENGFELIIKQFDAKKNKEFLDVCVERGCVVPINPYIVIKGLLEAENPYEILCLIKKMKSEQKNDWLYNFFLALSKENVNKEILEELYEFLKNDINVYTGNSCYRNIGFLNKFMDLEPNIYSIVCSKLFEVCNENNFIVSCYFMELFNKEEFSPERLCELFKLNMSLLKRIYFYMLKSKNRIDFRGCYLAYFISLDKEWLNDYLKLLCENDSGFNDSIIYQAMSLWKMDRFMEIFDDIFYNLLKNKHLFVFTNLVKQRDDVLVKQHQFLWIEHIIVENAFSDSIYLIFDFISTLDEEVKMLAIKTFLSKNKDFDIFKKLSISSNSWFSVGSLVPAFQKEIDFYESLIPILSGIDFLEHKKLIKERIERLEISVEREKIEQITSVI